MAWTHRQIFNENNSDFNQRFQNPQPSPVGFDDCVRFLEAVDQKRYRSSLILVFNHQE